MILTGRKLEEIGRDLYGDIWLSMLSKKLKRSKRTILRWKDHESAMPHGLHEVLIDLIDEHYAVLGKWRSDLASRWDDA